ncbi:Mth938-like domain-containing protein [Legionella nagasakiensis]|uniref:Mth938-like domain-containing protein n=1 Tax=Legionella nagasakiensis TaxID=535290 RepID=UPI0010560940|nr:MTH938/NDUFAF3 family protein [Legionella nagasakiensis]
MHITREQVDLHTIQSYSESEIKINNTLYERSVIISRKTLIAQWQIHSVQELNETLLAPMLELNPEVIIIGHNKVGLQASISVHQYLSKRRIGLECMSIGAACRTFNVLLSEQRAVVLGIIFS